MSGICGIYFLDGRRVEKTLLQNMLFKIRHRGPDKSGIWFEGSAGLGNGLLYTTEESLHEKLPLENNDVVLVADARIDNRDALSVNPTITDSELILNAYLKFGESCAEKLLGDFSFVIYDKKNKKLFCARDHMGVRPFYYYHLPNKVFIFASEIKAIFETGLVPKKLNEIRIADYLVTDFEDKEITSYKDIVRLPPASFLTLDPNGLKIKKYWTLDPKLELHLKSDEAYEEAFREHFTKAVKRRLRSAFPVGSLLSGGLDSSSIVCTAVNLFDKKLHTISAIFDESHECDEREYINKVISKYSEKLIPHFVQGDNLSPFTDFEKILYHQDEAFYVPNIFLPWAEYRFANEKGIRIVLDGMDGDSVVSHGQLRLAELFKSLRWVTLLKETNASSKYFKRSFLNTLWTKGIRPNVPYFILHSWQKSRYFKKPTLLERNPILNKNFIKEIKNHAGVNGRWKIQKILQTVKEDHYYRLTWGYASYILEIADKLSASFGIECRYPFYDKELIEFCYSMPQEQKMRNGWSRFILRKSMDNILPGEVQWRKSKTNMGQNFNKSLLKFEGERLGETIFKNSKLIEKHIDLNKLYKIYNNFMSSKTSYESVLLWQSAALTYWLLYTGISEEKEQWKKIKVSL